MSENFLSARGLAKTYALGKRSLEVLRGGLEREQRARPLGSVGRGAEQHRVHGGQPLPGLGLAVDRQQPSHVRLTIFNDESIGDLPEHTYGPPAVAIDVRAGQIAQGL